MHPGSLTNPLPARRPDPVPAPFKLHPLRAAVLGGLVALSPGLAITAMAGGSASPCASRNPCRVARACNPCTAKRGCNPCAAKRACNPCAVKRGCNPCNPCAAKRGCNPCNPCAAKRGCNPCNPCAAKRGCNPCAGGKLEASLFKRPCGVSVPVSRNAALIAEGERLWNDTSLSSNGLSCSTCHQGYGGFNPTFAKPYPHWVAMADQRAGVKQVTTDEMVQLCMVVPLAAEPLAWDGRQLAALTAYTVEVQKGFNPCRAKAGCNPCAAKRGCNPCNPCAAKRGCNPCAAKRAANPCNPCAAKRR